MAHERRQSEQLKLSFAAKASSGSSQPEPHPKAVPCLQEAMREGNSEDLQRRDPVLAVSDARAFLTPSQFAQLTGFSIHTIRDWAQQGLLPAIKVGNRLRFERDGAILALRNLNKKRRRRKRQGQSQSKT